MIDEELIKNCLNDLASKRPVFWSEADFQFAFAWELQIKLPKASIRLERRFDAENNPPMYIDIWVEYEGKVYPIELKYKTSNYSVKIGGEKYLLKTQSACDTGCHDFLKDINRIEIISKSAVNFDKGYAIMLTNDHLYWNKTRASSESDDTTFRDFRIYEGRTIEKGVRLQWYLSKYKSDGNMVDDGRRDDCIVFDHEYTINWKLYPRHNSSFSPFKYSIVEIDK